MRDKGSKYCAVQHKAGHLITLQKKLAEVQSMVSHKQSRPVYLIII